MALSVMEENFITNFRKRESLNSLKIGLGKAIFPDLAPHVETNAAQANGQVKFGPLRNWWGDEEFGGVWCGLPTTTNFQLILLLSRPQINDWIWLGELRRILDVWMMCWPFGFFISDENWLLQFANWETALHTPLVWRFEGPARIPLR